MTASPQETTRYALPPVASPLRILRTPGVYRPQTDTWLLAQAAAAAPIPRGAKVVDLCTGTGALAVTAAMLGAAEVTAVDVSRRAVLSAWLNARSRRLPVRVRHGSFLDVVQDGPFDVVLANPPYVPCPPGGVPRGRHRAWDAGTDGRALLDPICRMAPAMLTETGFLLLVHSAVSGVDRSLDQLRAGGLHATVVASHRTPFGPVMHGRAEFLEQRGFVQSGQRHEELVVIRADRS